MWLEFREFFERFLAAAYSQNGVSPFAKQSFIARTRVLFVFNNQDALVYAGFFRHFRSSSRALESLSRNLPAAGLESQPNNEAVNPSGLINANERPQRVCLFGQTS